jgi:pilus assembly protein Flp/PilA
MKRILRDFWRNESGATAIEYVLIAAVVGVGIIGAAQGITAALNGMFDRVEGNL